jgi:hypothetical protein
LTRSAATGAIDQTPGRRHLAMASDNNWNDEHEDGLELDGDNVRLL